MCSVRAHAGAKLIKGGLLAGHCWAQVARSICDLDKEISQPQRICQVRQRLVCMRMRLAERARRGAGQYPKIYGGIRIRTESTVDSIELLTGIGGSAEAKLHEQAMMRVLFSSLIEHRQDRPSYETRPT